MATTNSGDSFTKVLDNFKKTLKKEDKDNFKFTTLDQLEKVIGDLQKKQHSQRRLQNVIRLKPVLEALSEYGKVVEVFCNSNDIVAFVWGPLKFLLQVANAFSEAFNELLDVYEQIGETLPLLLQYKTLFESNHHMVRVLSLMYEDILKFHRIALNYFQQRLWKQMWQATWKTYKSRFSGVIDNMKRHRSLIESQANLAQVQRSLEFQKEQQVGFEKQIRESLAFRKEAENRFEADLRNEDLRRSHDVFNWLRATDVETDQYDLLKARADYPNTGRWLLDLPVFKDWFDPQYATIPPLLWLSGMPGAGKTVLASLIGEEARKLPSKPTVLLFYCKHKNPERDSFLAIARSFLAQLLKQDKALLLYLYEKSCESGEPVLTSPPLVNELLQFAFENCKKAYIIIDGVDECERQERKEIAQKFRRLVEELPTTEPDRLRCLFVSQDDGVARKYFAGLSNFKITAQDNKSDVDEYSKVEAEKLKETFGISDDLMTTMAGTVADSAGGMFLLAKLIWINMAAQTSVAALEDELDERSIPTEINEAYGRILSRIKQQPSKRRLDEALMLLSWLICAKRPLKWPEIQVLRSMNLERREVEFERGRFVVDPKNLCESLVERRSDGTLELVHLTARHFLVEGKHIDQAAAEISMASHCTDYLNLPAFTLSPSRDDVLNGSYGFMDYAVVNWIRHFQAGALHVETHDGPLRQLAESMSVFLELHWNSPSTTFPISKRVSDRLQFFKDYSFYGKLEQAVASTNKQLKSFGSVKEGDLALDLVDVVRGVRSVLEDIISSSPESSVEERIRDRYGSDLFKCPRFNCQSFSAGFSSADDRRKHVDQHERPFRCTELTCVFFHFGFPGVQERDKHVKETHSTVANQTEDFPTDQEIHNSIQSQNHQNEEDEQVPGLDTQNGVESQKDDPTQSSESEPIIEPQRQSARKRARKKDLKCEHCGKMYTKSYNLKSHLTTHGARREFQCQMCKRAFARASDLKRHEKKHKGENPHICGGTLKSGDPWGCGKTFSRADVLRNHYKSRIGNACISKVVEKREKREQSQTQDWAAKRSDIIDLLLNPV